MSWDLAHQNKTCLKVRREHRSPLRMSITYCVKGYSIRLNSIIDMRWYSQLRIYQSMRGVVVKV